MMQLLGCLDSNQGMSAPKADALPLGYTPMMSKKNNPNQGMSRRTATGCLTTWLHPNDVKEEQIEPGNVPSHSDGMPYHLATPQGKSKRENGVAGKVKIAEQCPLPNKKIPNSVKELG